MDRSIGLGYQPGLDGLRALAVTAVLLYHAQQNMPTSWLPGGFLGVEVFFAISGYLITALLVVEFERFDRIDVREFWRRRAKRLLPALFALLIVTIAVVGIAGSGSDPLREHVRAFRGMWLSAWVYFTNWYQIISGLNYSDRVGRPPLLRHLWSLAVEEQFYLIWPVVMWVVLRWFRKRQHVVGVLFASLGIGAAVITAALYRPADLGRVNALYLSTPTRSTGLLLGAALAMVWRPRRNPTPFSAAKGHLLDGLALAGAGVLAWSFLRWHFTTVTSTGTVGYDLLFRGGFVIVDVATLVLVLAATHPASFLGNRILGSAPLVWIGKRSYGLYLWHWPVFQLTRPRGDQSLLDLGRPDLRLSWLPALALRLAITLALTEASYRFLEMPIRRGALGRWWANRASSRRLRWATLACVCVPILALLVVSSTMSFGAADQLALDAACNAHPATCGNSPGESDTSGAGPPTSSPVTPPPVPPTSSGTGLPDPTTTDVGAAPGSRDTAPTGAAATTAPRPRSPLPPLAIGDSVMVGASEALRRSGIVVDAQVKRGFAAALSLVQQYRRQGRVGDVLVIGLGTGDGITDQQVDKLMAVLTSVPHVVFITPETAGRQYELSSREALLRAASHYPNVSLIDWQVIAQPKMQFHQGAKGVAFEDLYFYRDRVHLVSKGRRYFADLIIAEVERLSKY